MDESSPNRQRRVRSFVRRPGRMTTSQSKALEDLWPVFGIDWSDGSEADAADTKLPIDLAAEFGRVAPVVLEIGYGNGDTLVARAASDPDRNYLGIEVHEPGVGHCLIRAQEAGVTNLRLLRRDAIDVLRSGLAPATLSRVNLYFPDPWPKKRHHKRRLLGAATAGALQRVLAAHGRLYMATDWPDYAEQIGEVFDAAPGFLNLAGPGRTAPRYRGRVLTRFEERGIREGRRIVDFAYARRSAPPSTPAADRQHVAEVTDHRKG